MHAFCILYRMHVKVTSVVELTLAACDVEGRPGCPEKVLAQMTGGFVVRIIYSEMYGIPLAENVCVLNSRWSGVH